MKWLESLILAGIFAVLAFAIYFGMHRMFNTPLQPVKTDKERKVADEKNKVVVPKQEDMRWTEVTMAAPWEARDSGEVFLFQDKMWIMGGLNGNETIGEDNTIEYWKAPHFNDIWHSKDGVQWNQVTASAEWSPRRSMSAVFFKDKLWMFGGWSPTTGYTNDIWSSVDGIHWTQAVQNAEWPAREGQLAEIFQNKIWLIGGVNYDNRETKNDVWYSEDGISWTEARDIPWQSRWDHATTVHNGKIVLTGGMNLQGETFNDVWATEDGLTWRLLTENPPWEARQGHAMESYKGKLWLIGRFNDADSGGPNDVWYSQNGTLWKKTASDPQWKGREDLFSTVFKNTIWIFGGMDADWKWRNDIWQSNFISQ